MATQENLNKFKIGQCHNVGNCTHIGEKQAIPSDIANSGGFKCKYCGKTFTFSNFGNYARAVEIYGIAKNVLFNYKNLSYCLTLSF